MVYNPGRLGDITDVDELRGFLEDELNKISKEFNETLALDLRDTHREPERPREGMVVSADGADWNPGSGKGAYTYQNGAWVPMGAGVASAGNGLVYVSGQYHVGAGAGINVFADNVAVNAGAAFAWHTGGHSWTSVGNGTGPQYIYVATAPGNIGDATANKGALEVRNNAGGSAFMTFHSVGAFAGYFGMSNTGIMSKGGWSFGGVSYSMHDTQGVGQATNADMQAATIGTHFVSPGNVVLAPSATKGWVLFQNNVTIHTGAYYSSVTDNGPGDWTVVWGFSFSGSGLHACQATPLQSTATDDILTYTHQMTANSSRVFNVNSAGSRTDCDNMSVSVNGYR